MVDFYPFVYAHVDPFDPTHVRYVGLASKREDRPYQHMRAARRSKTKRTPHISWIRKLQSEGREPSVLILEELPSNALLGFVESCYISSLRTLGHQLTNMTLGGYGGDTGRLSTAEERAEMSIFQTGRKRSVETRALIAKAKRELVVKPETCAKLSAVLTGRKLSPESLMKRSVTLRARTPEQIQEYVDKCRITRARHKAEKS